MNNTPKRNFTSLAVYCGSNPGNVPKFATEAYDLGQFLAQHQIKLVYGAGKIGVMGQVAKGLLDHDGQAIGVVPKFLKHEDIVHSGLTELIVTQTMTERKLKMYELSDGFVALPGGFGTMEEIFEVLSWAQLALHQKPVGFLNVDGYYDDLLNMFSTMQRKGLLKQENLDLVLAANTIEELYGKMRGFVAKATPKWITKEKTA